MELKLYNTLTRSKEVFRPIDPDNVRMYVCGPTVYDQAHIGNARPVIVFDVLFRLLRHLASQGVWDGGKGQTEVTYVRNITDVDDKINARAARDYPDLPLNEAIRKVTEATNARFQADVKALGCLEPTAQPRATEHIDGMKAMIERLVTQGVAYVAEGHVLFSPSAMNAHRGPRYGALSRRPFDEMLAGARVDVASYKRDEMDFVLWKPSKDGEPGWPSPAGIEGLGRPGWHIECSAMSMAKLLEPFGGGLVCDDPTKNVFDIHGGGIDLVFPHHENEIAQSCCALGTDRMASIWMHNGFLQVEGRKMSKSEGNFVTIRDNLRGDFPGWAGGPWHGLVLRCAMLMTHYRQPIDWKLERLLEARSKLSTWMLYIRGWKSEYDSELRQNMSRVIESEPIEEVLDHIMDDMNTPLAISALHEYTERRDFEKNFDRFLKTLLILGLFNEGAFAANASISAGPIVKGSDNSKTYGIAKEYGIAVANGDQELADNIQNDLRRRGWNLRWLASDQIDLEPISSDDVFDVEAVIAHRLTFIREKNFAEADRIRDELLAQGIQLKDGKDPATGERITTWEVKR